MTLTDTQLILLSAAAQHEEHLITPLATLKGRAVQNALTSLIRHGLGRGAARLSPAATLAHG